MAIAPAQVRVPYCRTLAPSSELLELPKLSAMIMRHSSCLGAKLAVADVGGGRGSRVSARTYLATG